MLVYESMEACIFFCTCAKSSIHHSSLVNPKTDVPLQRSVPVRVPGRGRGSGSEAWLRVTLRLVITTTHMVARVISTKVG
jgi:hypothetical protein